MTTSLTFGQKLRKPSSLNSKTCWKRPAESPFGIAQIGKAFRNEITPRNFTFALASSSRWSWSFSSDRMKPWKASRLSGGVSGSGIRASRSQLGLGTLAQVLGGREIRFYESIGLPGLFGGILAKAGGAGHYARATVDILYKFPFAPGTRGIAARGDFDLSSTEVLGQVDGVF